MSVGDTTTVRTVVGHLADTWARHGPAAFERELTIYLANVRDYLPDDVGEAARQLLRLGKRLAGAIGLTEADVTTLDLALLRTLKTAPSVDALCEGFRDQLCGCVFAGRTGTVAGHDSRILAERTRQFLKACSARELQKLTVDNLAEQFSVSRSHLSRCYKAAYRRTVREAIRMQRLHRAFVLLSEGTHSVSEAALAVGYWNAKRFRNAFREQFGFCPGRIARTGLPDD